MLATLKTLTTGDLALVSYVVGGAELTKTMRVVKATRASVTVRDASGESTGPWRIKFADVGNEAPFANRLITVALAQ